MQTNEIFYQSDDGLTLYAREFSGPTPDAPVVLCLPGLTRNHRDFADLATALSATHRVICPDQRGRGQSARDPDPSHYHPERYVRDMQQLIAHLALSHVALIGTSLGGLMSMMMAAADPARVTAIVINDIGPVVDPAGLARIAGYVGKSEPVRHWHDAARRAKAINGDAFPDYTDADWQRMARELFREQDGVPVLDYDPAISLAFQKTIAATDLWPLFDKLRALPMLLIRGETSDILSSATADEMQRRAPLLQRIEVPQRGHAPSLGEPAARAAILQFIQSAKL